MQIVLSAHGPQQPLHLLLPPREIGKVRIGQECNVRGRFAGLKHERQQPAMPSNRINRRDKISFEPCPLACDPVWSQNGTNVPRMLYSLDHVLDAWPTDREIASIYRNLQTCSL